jgi:diadenosine tetraphosphate (Ap4A) HIT family hydrolase
MLSNPAPASCPFCDPASSRIFADGPLAVSLWDGYPVSPAHALIIPRRHVATWFDATNEEQIALLEMVRSAKAIIEERHKPDGYNIGINSGAAAGQTVFHLHIHLIRGAVSAMSFRRRPIIRSAWTRACHQIMATVSE